MDECKMLQEITLALHTQNHYVCSDCWGPLIVRHGLDGRLHVVCSRCVVTPGFVTKEYVERRRSESHAELAEARRNLEAVIPQKKQTNEEILQELGF